MAWKDEGRMRRRKLKAFNIVFKSILKMKKALPHEFIFKFISGISLGRYHWKSLAKSTVFGKNVTRGDGHKGGCL